MKYTEIPNLKEILLRSYENVFKNDKNKDENKKIKEIDKSE